ncbi:MAG: hypothetical protein JSY10_27970 [Paenibacillus sp.]|nr:hypothetical protein [Paenibacillus sp.]
MEKHASLVSILDTILNANIPLVGISVLEVLNSLFTHLIKSVHEGHGFNEDKSDSLEYAIHHGLVHSIGGLASQTYYLNQLNDITGYIISKLRVGNNALEVEGLPIIEYRRVVLKCLDRVTISSSTSEKEAQNDDTESNNENTPVYVNSITMDAWVPALGLLLDQSPGNTKKEKQIYNAYI